jgi:hypothetical protein
VTGRWHDNRHTLITDLAESGAGDQTIMDIAGHVSKRMLRHYSHIRMEAKRTALESIVKKQTIGAADQAEDSRSIDGAKTVGYHCPAGNDRGKLRNVCRANIEAAVRFGLERVWLSRFPQFRPARQLETTALKALLTPDELHRAKPRRYNLRCCFENYLGSSVHLVILSSVSERG